MKDGVNLVDWRKTSLEEIEMGLKEAWTDRRGPSRSDFHRIQPAIELTRLKPLKSRHLDDWATESTSPGVIIEAACRLSACLLSLGAHRSGA